MPIPGLNNLQILRGLSSNRSILSCTPGGHVVDLWNVDDNSGRQQWDIEPVTGLTNVYNFIIRNGLTSDRQYLSCTPDGATVDLWNVDDGSGRQRWVLNQVPNSPTCQTYLISVLAGVTSGRVYLSCTADGSTVDLWSVDDGSGRQRWQVQNVWIA